MMVTMQITTVYSTNQSFMWYVFLAKLCGILGNVQVLSILFKIIPCSTQISFHSLACFPLTYTIKESELIFLLENMYKKLQSMTLYTFGIFVYKITNEVLQSISHFVL